jgi:arylsulfatase A-like enzyme
LPTAAVQLAIIFGLCGGYLDLFLLLFRKLWWIDAWIVRIGRDFLWTIPAAHAALMLIPGMLMSAVCRLRPGLISLRVGSWILATLAIWAALSRFPLYATASLFLAAGLGRPISAVVDIYGRSRRTLRYVMAGLIGVLGVLGALSSGRQVLQERRALAGLPPSPRGARNVLLIVWDTVRAYNLSAYGYSRNTTPNLTRWAREGVRYKLALASAPWTYPSHSCFFTGQWPSRLNSQWKFTLDAPYPTLAEFLASQGYQTAGFSANVICCDDETGLSRGFGHFEDFPLTPRSFFGRTVPGRWIMKNLLYAGNYHDMKWIDLQSQGAWGTTDAFLGWLRGRRPDRPFFAFLNYFDAHAPYIPTPQHEGRFGIRPKAPKDYSFLFDYMRIDNKQLRKRDVQMARDCYDDCIAFLDEQLGRLLQELRGQGLLENTVVIITSDHGEAFGDHGSYGHLFSLHLDVTGVPLVILSPGAPAGEVVDSPVSLRDLPATVVALSGLQARSPFPGLSLTGYWPPASGRKPEGTTSPAFSERADATTFQPQPASGHGYSGLLMSLVAEGHHYLRDGAEAETLFDLESDPFERHDLRGTPHGERAVATFRRKLLEVLSESPGSLEAEAAYLERYRRGLKALVEERSPPRVSAGH